MRLARREAVKYPGTLPTWWNGRHRRLKICCLRACRFKSGRGYSSIFDIFCNELQAALAELADAEVSNSSVSGLVGSNPTDDTNKLSPGIGRVF